MKRTVLLTLFLFTAQVPATQPGGMEIWMIQPTVDIPRIQDQRKLGNSSHPGSPVSADVRGRVDRWVIDGMSLSASALTVGRIDASVTATVEVKNRTVIDLPFGKRIDKTTTIATLDNAVVSIRLKRAIAIPMPTKLSLRVTPEGNGARIELSEAGLTELRDHFSKQVDQLLSETSFDANFDVAFGNVSGLAEVGLKLFFNGKKGELLAGLRQHLKTEIARPGYFDRFLKDLDRLFPIPSGHLPQPLELTMDRSPITPAGEKGAVPLPENTWAVREKGSVPRFSSATLFEVAAPALTPPWAALLVHAVRLNEMIREGFSHLDVANWQRDGEALVYAPSALERSEIAKLLGQIGQPTDDRASRIFALEVAGPHAPIAQPWHVPAKSGQPERLFLDLWISARWIDRANPSAPQPRLGLLLVFAIGADGKLSLAQMSPYAPAKHAVGPAVPLNERPPFALHLGTQLELLLLQSLVNGQLAAAQPNPQSLPIRGIRMLGDRGARAPGERLVEALVVDLKTQ